MAASLCPSPWPPPYRPRRHARGDQARRRAARAQPGPRRRRAPRHALGARWADGQAADARRRLCDHAARRYLPFPRG
eukprot:3816888-Prymnesium_polylepis.1